MKALLYEHMLINNNYLGESKGTSVTAYRTNRAAGMFWCGGSKFTGGSTLVWLTIHIEVKLKHVTIATRGQDVCIAVGLAETCQLSLQ